MSDSSVQRAQAFDGLRWYQVVALLEVLRECDIHDERHIERRFRESATGYPRAAAFLQDIGIVTIENSQISCIAPLPRTASELAQMVLDRTLAPGNRYRAAVFRYLRRFRISAGEVSRCVDASARSKESPVRNFLMDLAIIRHRDHIDDYVLDPAYIPLYALALRTSPGGSPARIALRSTEREEMGLAAETAVVGVEQRRLGPELANLVEHVSLRNAGAGYDVLSATATSHGVLPRYIEVKAVSSRSWQFFWTQNEARVASVLGPQYYLYLVPVGLSSELLIERVMIIRDPNRSVFGGDDWIVESNVHVCRPRSTGSVMTGGCK